MLAKNKHNIRQGIISYSDKNATQKICEVQGGLHIYIMVSNYQTAIAPYPYHLTLKKERRRKIKPLTAFYCDLESYLFVQYFITIA